MILHYHAIYHYNTQIICFTHFLFSMSASFLKLHSNASKIFILFSITTVTSLVKKLATRNRYLNRYLRLRLSLPPVFRLSPSWFSWVTCSVINKYPPCAFASWLVDIIQVGPSMTHWYRLLLSLNVLQNSR